MWHVFQRSMNRALPFQAKPLLQQGAVEKLLDPRLRFTTKNSNQIAQMVQAAAACLQSKESRRPEMGEIIAILKGREYNCLINKKVMPGNSSVIDCYPQFEQTRSEMKTHLASAVLGIKFDDEDQLYSWWYTNPFVTDVPFFFSFCIQFRYWLKKEFLGLDPKSSILYIETIAWWVIVLIDLHVLVQILFSTKLADIICKRCFNIRNSNYSFQIRGLHFAGLHSVIFRALSISQACRNISCFWSTWMLPCIGLSSPKTKKWLHFCGFFWFHSIYFLLQFNVLV